MSKRTNCIDRAGQILISCIWIEKRLIDLIILKEHTKLVKKINNIKNEKLPDTFVEERFSYWKKDFGKVKESFIEKFDTPEDWKEQLEFIYNLRNMIGHSHISLYRDYLLYTPNGGHEKLNKLINNMITIKKEKSAKTTTFILRLTDDEIYEKLIKIITEFDQKYLEYIAKSIGVNYEKIR